MRTIRIAAFILASAFLSAALASEPGQPLDCSDWVFLEPGLSCQYWVTYPCDYQNDTRCVPARNGQTVDNEGRMFRLRWIPLIDQGRCPTTNNFQDRIELVAWTAHSESVIAYIEDRCPQVGYEDWIDWNDGTFLFLEESGRLVLPNFMSRGCAPTNCGTPVGAYETVFWTPVIVGLPTTFEVQQSYCPTTSSLFFRAPYLPEGLPAADYFDTYYGGLDTVGDWSQAQPLQCGYPATAPSVGDYLTVADELPGPTPGQGRYYVTAVNYQGQRRYGRKSMGGVLSGRDPAVLPACQQ